MRKINKGKGSQPKDDRNKKLIADYELVRKGELKPINIHIIRDIRAKLLWS